MAGTIAGLRASGRRLSVTRYRPQPWTPRDTLVAGFGLAAFAVAIVANSPAWPAAFDAFHPSIDPLVWPGLHPLMLVVAGLAAAPLLVTPSPVSVPVPARSLA